MMTQNTHTIAVNDLKVDCHYDSNDTGKFKRSIKALQTKRIEYYLFDQLGETEGWGVGSLISWMEVKGGVCEYEYPSKVRHLLSDPEIYARIDIEMATKIKSGYSYIIYEMCKSYAGLLNKRSSVYTMWYGIEKLHELLDTSDKASYTLYGDLKRKLINKGIKDVNALSDILIELEEKREGRKVSEVRFKVSKNKNFKSRENGNDGAIDGEVVKRSDFVGTDEYKKVTGSFEVNSHVSKRIFGTHSLKYIAEKIEITDTAIAQGSISTNVAGFFVAAIDKNYKPAPKPPGKKNDVSHQIAEHLERLKADVASNLLKVEKKFSEDAKNSYLASLSDEEKSLLLDSIREEIPSAKSLTQPSFGYLIVDKIDGYEQRKTEFLKKKEDALNKRIPVALEQFKKSLADKVSAPQQELI